MSETTIQDSVAVKIKALYEISQEVRDAISRTALYAGWPYDREHWRGTGSQLL